MTDGDDIVEFSYKVLDEKNGSTYIKTDFYKNGINLSLAYNVVDNEIVPNVSVSYNYYFFYITFILVFMAFVGVFYAISTFIVALSLSFLNWFFRGIL